MKLLQRIIGCLFGHQAKPVEPLRLSPERLARLEELLAPLQGCRRPRRPHVDIPW